MNKTIDVLRKVIADQMQVAMNDIRNVIIEELDEIGFELNNKKVIFNRDLSLSKDFIIWDKKNYDYGRFEIRIKDFELTSEIILFERGEKCNSKIKSAFYNIHTKIEEITTSFNNA